MKKILIVSYTAYPDRAVAAIRVSQWAKHLAEFGWTPTIACRYHGVTATSKELEQELHSSVSIKYLDKPVVAPDTKIHQQTSSKHKAFIRQSIVMAASQFSVPDISIWTWQKLAPKVIQLVREGDYDLVLTSSPPHAIHSVGLALKKEIEIPWVADFRDPFLDDPRFKPRGFAKLMNYRFRQFEKRILDTADRCVVAISQHFESLVTRYPEHESKLLCLPNGFPVDMPLPTGRHTPLSRGTMRMTTAGVISQESVKFVYCLAEELKKTGIRLIFNHFGPKPQGVTSENDPSADINFNGLVPHKEALSHLCNSDILLVLSSAERARYGLLSSKLFEYIATGRPTLVIRPTASDRSFVSDYSWVSCVDDLDIEFAKSYTARAHDGKIRCDCKQLDNYRQQFNRRSQTLVLANLLYEALLPGMSH